MSPSACPQRACAVPQRAAPRPFCFCISPLLDGTRHRPLGTRRVRCRRVPSTSPRRPVRFPDGPCWSPRAQARRRRPAVSHCGGGGAPEGGRQGVTLSERCGGSGACGRKGSVVGACGHQKTRHSFGIAQNDSKKVAFLKVKSEKTGHSDRP